MSKEPFDGEQVSCCVDGEANDYLRLLSQNEKARERWCRFHFIGSVIRDSAVTPLPENFHKRVMQAISNEPTVFAPGSVSPRKFSFNRQSLKPLAGMAIAATVAAVTVLGFQNFYASERGQLLLSALRGDTSPAAVELPAGDNNLVSSQAEKILASNKLSDSELDAYLLGHMEQSTGGGSAQGMLPYVRLAGYDDSQ